jgi:hypothetical protein
MQLNSHTPSSWHFRLRFQMIENKNATATRPVKFLPLRQIFVAAA